ncbi:MAG: HD domain-containing protein [Candidatus Pacebacteria bacterium]|nr:HD domain-containing protein [Candidatus Paceibacterota bacterium]
MMTFGGRDHIPKKAVCVPGGASVDISAFLPIIDHPLFQRLRWRKQLGVNFLVFPGAVHTRFEHAIGTLGLTQRLCQAYGVSGPDVRRLCGFALLHDIGHGPFSHQIEPIAGGGHHGRGVAYLAGMSKALQACGLSVAEMTTLFTGQDPLSVIVSDRNLGTDKLDYLRRDALHIGFTGMPDVEKIQRYAFVQDGTWLVEERFIEDVKRIQKFYSYLHQHGYLNKTALAVQRVFQRAVQEELVMGTATSDDLWEMTDDELLHWLHGALSPVTQQLIERLQDRSFHRSVYVIKPRGYGFVERRSSKGIIVREWPREDIRRFSEAHSNVAAVLKAENELAQVLGCDHGDVLFAAMPYFAKLVPRDVRIYSARDEGDYWLFANDKDHFRSLQGDYLRTFAIRIITPPHLRDHVLEQGAAITEFLKQKIG